MNPAAPDSPRSFEESLTELESIVRELEAGETTLEVSLERYEAGIRLLRQCHAQLRDAEQRVLLLSGEDENGRPITRPFDHSPAVEGESTDLRRRSRRNDSSY